MKTTIQSILVIAIMLLCGSCKKEDVLPEKITVSGQVTNEAGQPVKDVQVQVGYSSFMGVSIPLGDTHYTDENGLYQIEFAPDLDYTYTIDYEITIEDYYYHYSYDLTKWEAIQEHDVVLRKTEE